MAQKYWFKAKKWGYGWSYPLTWQGWAVYAIFFSPIIGFSVWAVLNAPPKMSDADFNRITFIAVGVLLFVLLPFMTWFGVQKGEPARWRWGNKK